MIDEAVQRYGELRSSVDAPPMEAVGHFFGVDGVGDERDRALAFLRLKPTEEELERWMGSLQ